MGLKPAKQGSHPTCNPFDQTLEQGRRGEAVRPLEGFDDYVSLGNRKRCTVFSFRDFPDLFRHPLKSVF